MNTPVSTLTAGSNDDMSHSLGFALTPHPACLPSSSEGRLWVQVSRLVEGLAPAWLLRYELTGDMAALRVPEPGESGQADGLWRHTCFEAFVSVAGQEAYREFNFSPSGKWAIYDFSQERVRDPAAEALRLTTHVDAEALTPAMQWQRTATALTLQVCLSTSHLAGLLPEVHESSLALSPPTIPPTLRLGLTAVVQDQVGDLSYWALQHPRARPDFHNALGWTAQLP